MERNLRKERVGIVVSDKMDKTVVVAIEERFKHPLYKKTVKKTASKVCASKAKLTRVIAKFDAGWGNHLFIRGLGGSLDWQKGVAMQNISEDEWLWEQLVPCGTIAFKILLNDENWSEGEDLVVSAGDTVICRPSFQ